MSSFLDYLDSYEKKFETKSVPVQQPNPITETKKTIVPKKVIKIIKKPVVTYTETKTTKPINENINRATNILDGIEEDYNPLPYSARVYDNTSYKQTTNEQNKSVASRAGDILGEDNNSSEVSLHRPLMNIPPIDNELLRFVPKEMLTEQQRIQVQQLQPIQPKNINTNETKEQEIIPPELQKMNDETKQLQQNFTNIDMSDIPQEILETLR